MLPLSLSHYELVGSTDEHLCLQVERQIYVYWLVGHFKREHLDRLTELVVGAPGFRQPYVSIAFTEGLSGYDADLRTVITHPGGLLLRKAMESIVVSDKPLERMVVRTMSLAGRAAGNPGGRLAAASTFEEALAMARATLA
ncbi:MAG: hypothetical protein H6719_37110 [Sandaracinaceae bacterium]|nr:hypothetical protein [Sandaracinaceae bacterium]